MQRIRYIKATEKNQETPTQKDCQTGRNYRTRSTMGNGLEIRLH